MLPECPLPLWRDYGQPPYTLTPCSPLSIFFPLSLFSIFWYIHTYLSVSVDFPAWSDGSEWTLPLLSVSRGFSFSNPPICSIRARICRSGEFHFSVLDSSWFSVFLQSFLWNSLYFKLDLRICSFFSTFLVFSCRVLILLFEILLFSVAVSSVLLRIEVFTSFSSKFRRYLTSLTSSPFSRDALTSPEVQVCGPSV